MMFRHNEEPEKRIMNISLIYRWNYLEKSNKSYQNYYLMDILPDNELSLRILRHCDIKIEICKAMDNDQ
jgi:hypothetical protein